MEKLGTEKMNANNQSKDPLLCSNDHHDDVHDDQDHNNWRIILYYCYIDIMDDEKVNAHVQFQQNICQEHKLQGRIRVSREGINGVLSGKFVSCQNYEEKLRIELQRISLSMSTSSSLSSHDNDKDDDGNYEIAKENDLDLDMKYCRLRPDLPVQAQLFDSLSCKSTYSVVSLFEPNNHDNNGNKSNKKQSFSKQSNRRRRRQEQKREQQRMDDVANHIPDLQEIAEQLSSFPGGQHLSPLEWHEKLINHGTDEDTILLDCRNVYESNVGYFQTPDPNKAVTLLTNTRKYSDLPKVLAQSKDQWINKRKVFMYCTGGVRCEMASKFVQALAARELSNDEDDVLDQQQKEQQLELPEVYQLHGGIQKYLEYFDTNSNSGSNNKSVDFEEEPISKNDNNNNNSNNSNNDKNDHASKRAPSLYKGLNFVFDPRRTDPMKGENVCVGKCCLCGVPHDDYDNCHAPVEEKVARCCKCRILLLVCNICRHTVQCWGEEDKEGLPKLYCGIDACSDYQSTGTNPASILKVIE